MKFKNSTEARDALKAAVETVKALSESDGDTLTEEQATELDQAHTTAKAAKKYLDVYLAEKGLADADEGVDWTGAAKAYAASASADAADDSRFESLVADATKSLNDQRLGEVGRIDTKALTVVDGASAGVLNRPVRGEGDPTGRTRTLNLVDLINWVPVDITQTHVEHPRLASRTDNANFVAEWDAALNAGAGGFPRVPESDYTFELEETKLADIGAGIPMSYRASQTEVRGWVETLIKYDIRSKVNDSVLTGDGTSNSFVGVLHTTGIVELAHVDGANEFDMLSHAISLNAGRDTAADTVVFNPTDEHLMRTLRESYTDVDPDGTPASGDEYKQGEGMYLAGGPASGTGVPAWGLSQTVSHTLTDGIAVVGQFSGAALRGRFQEELSVKIGDQFEDYQARGEAKFLTAYQRGTAVEVIKPTAFVVVELRPGALAAARAAGILPAA